MKHEEIKERLKLIIKELNISLTQFAQSVGMSAAGISKLLSGTGRVSQTPALAIQAVYGYQAKWILTGKGKKWADPEPKTCPEKFPDLTNDEQEIILLLRKQKKKK